MTGIGVIKVLSKIFFNILSFAIYNSFAWPDFDYGGKLYNQRNNESSSKNCKYSLKCLSWHDRCHQRYILDETLP